MTGESVFDTKDHNGSFFYTGPELTHSPREWFRAGLVAQKTKAYHTSLDVQRGFLVGMSHKKFNFTTSGVGGLWVFAPELPSRTLSSGGWDARSAAGRS